MSKQNPWTDFRIANAALVVFSLAVILYCGGMSAYHALSPDPAIGADTWERELELASDRAARKADEKILGAQPEYRVRQDSLWILIGENKSPSRSQWEFVGIIVPADTCIRRISERRVATVETWK